MAVRYAYKIKYEGGGTETVNRRMVIPESSDEKLRGETYDQDQIDWLHKTEQDNIANQIELRHGKGTKLVGKPWTEDVGTVNKSKK